MLGTNIHPKFRLNGKSFSKEALVALAHSYKQSYFEYEQECGQFLSKWLDANDTIDVQTSGTTGKPKIIKIKKLAMVNSAIATGEFLQLSAGNSALCCLPVKYIAGKMMLVRAMVLGLELDLVEPKSNPLENNFKHYDFVAMVPLQVEKSLQKLNQIQQLIIGGAKVNQMLENELKVTSCQIYESYSMTETVTHIALKRIGEKMFSVLPKVSITADERGCLVIEAPQLNSEKIVTNDSVEILSEKQFIWKGRIDNVINSGGIKLFPEQIEEKLSHTISNRFFIAGMFDERLGEKVILVIEGNAFDFPQKAFEILDKYERPKEIYFLPKFLETETGKIKRKEMMSLINQKSNSN